MLYCAVLYCPIYHCAVLYCIALYCVVLRFVVFCCIVWCCIVSCCIVLHRAVSPGARAGGVETQGLLVPAAVARAGDAPGVPVVHAAGRLPAAPHLHDLHLRQHLSPPVAGSLPASLHPSRTVSSHHSFFLWLVAYSYTCIYYTAAGAAGEKKAVAENVGILSRLFYFLFCQFYVDI